jgi:hypothetical protein
MSWDVVERGHTNPEDDPMIRNTLFGLSLLALTTGSAFAAPVKHTGSKPRVVAEAKTPAPAGDSTAADKPAKKTKKSAKKVKGDDAAKTEGGGKEMKAAPEAK